MAERDKQAGQTQVAWALLTEGVAQARLEAHRLRHLMTRVLKLVDRSEAKEHIYEVAGDMIQVAPRRMEALENTLDRTSYALSVLGVDHLRERLPMSDRALIDDATHTARPFHAPVSPRSTARVAYRYLLRQADLAPPLGFPGGPCHVVQRIMREIRNPRLRDELVDDVEVGVKLTNADAAKVYELEEERAPTGSPWKKLQIVPHAQYRMDQRGITVPELRMAIQSFTKKLNDEKSRKSPTAQNWEWMLARHEPFLWTDPRHKLSVVFTAMGSDTLRLITTYWQGQPDPAPVGEGSCPVTG